MWRSPTSWGYFEQFSGQNRLPSGLCRTAAAAFPHGPSPGESLYAHARNGESLCAAFAAVGRPRPAGSSRRPRIGSRDAGGAGEAAPGRKLGHHGLHLHHAPWLCRVARVVGVGRLPCDSLMDLLCGIHY